MCYSLECLFDLLDVHEPMSSEIAGITIIITTIIISIATTMLIFIAGCPAGACASPAPLCTNSTPKPTKVIFIIHDDQGEDDGDANRNDDNDI